MTTGRWVRAAALACGVLGGLASPARAAESRDVPGRSQAEIALVAGAGDRVLCFGAYLRAPGEGPIEHQLRLDLNGVAIDGSRLLGPRTITTPLLEKAYGLVHPLYRAEIPAFALPCDADDTANNGPWVPEWRPARYKTNHRLPWMQFDVAGLLKPGTNTLRITNGSKLPCVVTVARTAAAYSPLPDPILAPPTWLVLAESAEERALYEAALAAGTYAGAERGELLAALGLADLLAGEGPRRACRRWAEALQGSAAFPSHDEIACRLVAARVQTGRWPLPEPQVRGAVGRAGPDGWGGLARALLGLLEGRPASADRLVVRIARSAGPVRVDGVLDERCWAGASAIDLCHDLGEPERLRMGLTEARVAQVPGGLAVAFTGRMPEPVTWTTGLERDASVWRDNAVELLVAPDILRLSPYFEFNATPLGGRFDGRNEWWWKCNPGWNGAWEACGRIEGPEFVIEYLIPWSTLELAGRPRPGHVMAASIIRVLVDPAVQPRQARLLAATPHGAPDAHRLMDGVVLCFD